MMYSTKNIRKRSSSFKKEEIINYYAPWGNHRETTRAFKLLDSLTPRKICEAGRPKISKHGGFKGGKA